MLRKIISTFARHAAGRARLALSSPLHKTMLRNYKLAIEHEPPGFKSSHWSHFVPNFERFILDETLWKTFRRNGITAGYDDSATTADKRHIRHIQASGQSRLGQVEALPEEVSDAQVRQGLIEWYQSLQQKFGREFVERAYDNRIGSPMHVSFDGKMLNVTDLDHLSFAWSIWELVASSTLPPNLVIVEIGGGYGGMACVLKRIFPEARIILLDLPEVTCTQTYYVSRSFPNTKIAHYEDLAAETAWNARSVDFDFAIVPGWCIERLQSQSVDLFVNIRSMQEMNWATIRYYFNHIHRTIAPDGIFYCANRYSKDTADVQPVILREYPFDDFWTPLLSAPIPRQKKIHQLILKRTTEPNLTFRDLLRALPG